MESQLKQRLVGIAVIVSLAVIFLPMLLDGAGVVQKTTQFEEVGFEIPPPPKVERREVNLSDQVQQLNKRINEIPPAPIAVLDKQNNKQQAQIIRPATDKNSKVTKIGGDSWIAQLGSFKDQDKAFKLQDKVRTYKIAAVFIQKIMLKNGYSYRVRLGPFLYQKQAQSAAAKLKKKYKIAAVVMKHEK